MKQLDIYASGLCCFTLLAIGGCYASPPAAALPTADIKTKVLELKNKTLKELVTVKGGTFTMGDFGPIDPRVKMPYSGQADNYILRKVTLSDYAILSKKVTYSDYDIYTDATGKPRIDQFERDAHYRNIPDIPAGVNWHQAQQYCQWIGNQLGKTMDLPTEAQWEYAARSRGQLVVWPTDTGQIDNGRNVESATQAREFRHEHGYISGMTPVGKYPPNPLGMYDMIDHGFEWVRDWYASSYDPKDTIDPLGPKTGTEKVQRAHSDSGGDLLAFVSMTFTRFHSPPSPPPFKSYDSETPLEANQNVANTFRCVASPHR